LHRQRIGDPGESQKLTLETGDPRVDNILTALVDAFEEGFPGRVRNYAVLGSYARGTPRATSDLDVIVLFRGAVTSEERARAEELAARLKASAQIDLDLDVESEESLNPITAVCLTAGRDVLGRPLPGTIPPIDEYAWDAIVMTFDLVENLRPTMSRITHPLTLPNPALDFFGYEAKPLRDTDGRWAPSTKALSMVTGWAATAILAVSGGVYTPTKAEAIASYRTQIGDEWADLLDEIDDKCRRQWQYSIPSDTTDRANLKHIAGRTLAFENHALDVFRPHVLGKLTSSDEKKQGRAIDVLSKVCYTDDETRAALSSLKHLGETVTQLIEASG
jgi:predicted nucleotidyltransferase